MEVCFVRLDTNTNIIDNKSQSQTVCDGSNGLNEEINFDRESININGVSNENIHDCDSLYARPENQLCYTMLVIRLEKNHGWNIIKKGFNQWWTQLHACCCTQ